MIRIEYFVTSLVAVLLPRRTGVVDTVSAGRARGRVAGDR